LLKVGGTFIAKIFRGRDTTLLYAQLKIFFNDVSITKPRSSRNASIEAFVVCQDYRPPQGYVPTMLHSRSLSVTQPGEDSALTGINRVVIPFVSCGDLNGFDSDQTYALTRDHAPLEAILPIAPPYQKAKELRKCGHLDSATVVL